MSTRLSESVREAICRRALNAAFDKERKQIERTEDGLARRCYNAVFTLAERRKVNDLPERWFNAVQKAAFNIGGHHIELRFAAPVRVPADNIFRLGVVKDTGIRADIDKLMDAKKDMGERRKRAEVALDGLLGSVTTIKRLRDIWPEGEQFFEPYETGPTPQLPAIQIKEVNRMLGLKVAA